MDTILLKGIRAIDAENDFIADIYIADGKIKHVADSIEMKADIEIDGTGLAVMPSFFDMHVHFRDPGFTHKEDVITGCNAALAGGVTGVLCMPNTKPPVDNPETVKYIIDKAEDTGVEVYPVGCITNGMCGKGLCDYDELKQSGVLAVSDDGRPVENAEQMREALEKSNNNGLLVISHYED